MTSNPFEPSGLTFDEYRNQDVIDTGDGEFFDHCDSLVGVIPRTDKLANENGSPNGDDIR